MTADNAPALFSRNMATCECYDGIWCRRVLMSTVAMFHAFLIATSFLKERSDRQMFALRQQLKIQYR